MFAKKIIFFFSFYNFSLLMTSEKMPIINIHLNLDTNNILSSSTTIPSHLKEPEYIKKTHSCFFNFIENHKYATAFSLISTLYLYVNYRCYTIEKLLQSPSSWCNWKEIVSTQQLVATQQQELIYQLLNDIQKKYFLTYKTTICSLQNSSFDQFIKDIMNELTSLQQYITIKEYASALYLKKIFRFSYKKSIIQEKINRLQFIMDLFLTWQTKELLK
ncbi:hypothetical protein HYV11_03585 [Candidatus Dependentiae bacterium]|nr:hypothetical protein [Candidatus Dependentiae bacterium]